MPRPIRYIDSWSDDAKIGSVFFAEVEAGLNASVTQGDRQIISLDRVWFVHEKNETAS